MSCKTLAALSLSMFGFGVSTLGQDCKGCSSVGSVANGDCYGMGDFDNTHGTYNIYGCYGSFSGGMDDDSVDNICGDGYHVCESATEAFNYGLTSSECSSVSDNELFFLRESSSNGYECTSLSNSNGGNNVWACGGGGDDNIFTIGKQQCQDINSNDKFEDCLSLTHVCGYYPKGSYDTSVLNTGNDRDGEYYQIELNDKAYGGVLCCQDEDYTHDPCDGPVGERTVLYRWYHPTAVNHFYTTSTTEPDSSLGYIREGNMGYLWKNKIEGITVPLYRYYDQTNVDHFYTTNWNELGSGSQPGQGWHYEGIQGYIMKDNCPDFNMPLYRYWNIAAVDHFYTINYNELGAGNANWKYEGIAGYVAKY